MNICIVGTGMMGGSYARALKKLGHRVFGIDINEEYLNYGIENHIIDEKALADSSECKKILKKTDILILCIYPSKIKEFIEKNKNNFKKGIIITDISGLKSQLGTDLKDFLTEDLDFILAHPMTGKEKIGIEHSDEIIFKEANFILTPIEENKKENIEIIKNMVKDMGFKNIIELSPLEHDEIVAFTSQLTHAIAVALINSDDEKVDTQKCIGNSFRDLTRIAKINDVLWEELFMGNRNLLIKKIEAFENNIKQIKDALVEKDSMTLIDLFKNSTQRRESLEKN